MTTDITAMEALYIGEQTLDMDIRKYLVHLAALAKEPIMLGVHGRPQGISVDIHKALSLHEQHLISRKEEIAGDELTDPHSAASIGAGRRELSDLIAMVALPLASNVSANEVQIDLQIGHGLPSPYAPEGLAICVVFDCRQGTMRYRFAPEPEQIAPSPEKEVTLGMTAVARPIKVGMNQINEDSSRSQIMSLLQSDGSLFRLTMHVLLILGHLQQAIDFKFSDEQQNALKQARSTMAAVMLAIRTSRQQDAAISALSADQQAATVTMPPVNQVRQALQAMKNVSPRLGMAIARMETALERLVPVVQAHAASHNQIASIEHAAAKETMREPQPKHSEPHAQHGPALTPEEH